MNQRKTFDDVSEELRHATHVLLAEIAKELRIYRLIDWLLKKLTVEDYMNTNPTMSEMIEIFEDAKEFGANYIAVKIEMEGFEKPEVIINEKENIDSKLTYYKNTYNEDLTHKYSNGIRIVDYSYGNTYDEFLKNL